MRKPFTIFLLCLPFLLSAQTKIGVRGGLNLTNIIFKINNNNQTGLIIPRLNAGLLIEIPLDENWFINSGPYYSGKGTKAGRTLSGKKDSMTIHLNYIDLPLNIMYKFSEDKENRFILGVGLYIGYGFNGALFWKGGIPETEKHLHRKEAEEYKRFDGGINFTVMYEIKHQWGIRLDYSKSIFDIFRQDLKEKNNVYGLSFFWYLNKRKESTD